MPTGNAKFEAAANEAGCHFLLAAGGAAAQFTAYSLLTGSLVTGAAGAAATGIAAYAYAKNCSWDPTPPGDPYRAELTCCPENGFGEENFWYYTIRRTSTDELLRTDIGTSFGYSGQYNVGVIEPPATQGQNGRWLLAPCGTSYTASGSLPAAFFGPDFYDLRINPPDSAPCGPTPPPTPPGPYTYTDPDDGCQIQVTFESWAVGPDGSYSPVWRMDPLLPPAARASGGIIGGCNFNPVIYYDPPGGGGGGTIPIPPDLPGGDPWWMDFLKGALGGLAAGLAEELLDKLFGEKLPTGNITVHAACDKKEDGTPETFTINFPSEPWADRVLTALNAGVDIQQQILLWKTPVCMCGGKPVTGDAVSINWVSDEYSPFGNDRIRKLLTYFDQAGSTLEQTVAHWKDFTWSAGPVIVSCCGTDLGKPQVWASSEAEAKRVIYHAAAIAGVDLTDAEWAVSTAKSARYGQGGLMRVHRSGNGTLGITKRDGPSGSPVGLA